MPRPSRLLGPLTSGLTYRRFVHLLLGAVLLLPYVALAALFELSVRVGGMEPYTVVPLAAVAVAAGVGVALVPGVRALEIAAARALLGARLADPDPATADAWPARMRATLWLLLNMLVGGGVALLTLLVLPVAVGLVLAPWVAFTAFPTGLAAAWAPLVGVLTPVALLYAGSALGGLLARVAPWFLGLSTAERLAVELAQSRRAERALAQRNRLARELHDSIGHALTITTLQAGAAARVLDSDPAFAARALDAIAEAGRTALEELDHVLGLLRDGDDRDDRRTAPDLRDLDALLASTRSAGVAVDAEVVGAADAVPAAVSREAYRIVQEGLTNALRHAGPVPVAVRVAVAGDVVELAVTNPLAGASPTGAGTGGGRGIAGVRERVEVLRGDLVAGRDGGNWRMSARLPLTHRPEQR